VVWKRSLDWIATTVIGSKVFKHTPGDTSSLCGVYIYALFKDRSGNLWVGCHQYLDRFDPQTETFVHYQFDAAARRVVLAPWSISAKTMTACCGYHR